MKALAAHEATIAEATVTYEEPITDNESDAGVEAEVKEAVETSSTVEEDEAEKILETESAKNEDAEGDVVIEGKAEFDNEIETEDGDEVNEEIETNVEVDAEAEAVDEVGVEDELSLEVKSEKNVTVSEEAISDGADLHAGLNAIAELAVVDEYEFDPFADEGPDERPLTDYTVDELLSFDDSLMNESDRYAEANDKMSADFEDVSDITEMTVGQILSTPEKLTEVKSDDSSEVMQEGTQDCQTEPELNTQEENDGSKGFFEEPNRDIDIPNEKQGFFNRMFN